MVVTVDGVQFSSPKEFLSFCDKLKQLDTEAYNKFLTVKEVQPVKIIKTVAVEPKQPRLLPKYCNYEPEFWFQYRQQKPVPVYSSERSNFTWSNTVRFLREFRVRDNNNRPVLVKLYYDGAYEIRFAVKVKE